MKTRCTYYTVSMIRAIPLSVSLQGNESGRAHQRCDMRERRRAMMVDWAAFLDGQDGAKLNVVEFGAVG